MYLFLLDSLLMFTINQNHYEDSLSGCLSIKRYKFWIMISMDSTSLNTSFMVESQDKSVYEPSCKNDHWKFIPWPNVIKKWFETTTWGGFLRWQLVAGAQPGTHITRRDFISGGFDLGEWNPWFLPWKFGWLPVNRPIIQCWDSIRIYPEMLVDCFCMFLYCEARIISSTPV